MPIELLKVVWRPIVEITILTVALYYAFLFVRGTRGWPVVLGLIGLAEITEGSPRRQTDPTWELFALEGKQFWPYVHGSLMLLAAVGVCVGFVASVMYLVQTYRLKTKRLPGKGLKGAEQSVFPESCGNDH